MIIKFSFPQLGDTILAVNGRKVQDLKTFYQYIRVASPTAKIEIKRPLTTKDDIKDNLPPDLERRPGYQYEVGNNFCAVCSLYPNNNFSFFFAPIQVVKIRRIRGIHVGLSIKTRDNRVIVLEVKPNSMCSNLLKLYDQIAYIDGNRVSQAEMAQVTLATALKTVGFLNYHHMPF